MFCLLPRKFPCLISLYGRIGKTATSPFTFRRSCGTKSRERIPFVLVFHGLYRLSVHTEGRFFRLLVCDHMHAPRKNMNSTFVSINPFSESLRPVPAVLRDHSRQEAPCPASGIDAGAVNSRQRLPCLIYRFRGVTRVAQKKSFIPEALRVLKNVCPGIAVNPLAHTLRRIILS